MAALTAPRNTLTRSGFLREPPVEGATKILQGSMVAINASGLAVPASTSTTLKVIGRAEATADNSAGAAAAIRVTVARGIFRFGNSSAGDAIALSDVTANCYAVDDQTVAKTNGTGTRSVAGRIFDVDALGVWVEFL